MSLRTYLLSLGAHFIFDLTQNSLKTLIHSILDAKPCFSDYSLNLPEKASDIIVRPS